MTTEDTRTVVQLPSVSYVMLGLLNLDRGYQRDINTRKVERIAQNWDWVQFDPLSVSRRVGGPRAGELFVWDGQHRYLAAAEKFGEYQEIPCYISDLTYQQEAEYFARQHENETLISGNSRFNALLQANDPEALDMMRIVREAGFQITLQGGGKISSGNTIQAVTYLLRFYQRMGPEGLKLILYVISAAWPVGLPERVNARILGGMAHFLYHFPEAKIDHLIERLSQPDATPQRILQNSSVYQNTSVGGSSGGMYPHVSRAILDKYNKHLKGSHRLVWGSGKNVSAKRES